MFRRIIRALGWLLLLLITSIAAYTAYALLAWRDIPVAQLEQRYGDADLRQITIDGVNIRYRLQGQAPDQAPTVVLIHNHFMDMGLWDDWLPLLSDSYSLLRYDLSGHGLTGPDPSGEYTVQRDVELLQGLLQALQLHSVALVGSSLGGNIAFRFAADYPQQTRALVLINSGGLKRANSRSGREMPNWANFAFRLVPPQLLHKFLRWMVINDAQLDDADVQRFASMFRRSGNRQAEIARLSQFDSGNPDAVLARITAPTLLLWGQDNPQLPVALMQQFQRKLTAVTQLQSKSYPQAGHVLPLEYPQASARDTRNFLAQQLSP